MIFNQLWTLHGSRGWAGVHGFGRLIIRKTRCLRFNIPVFSVDQLPAILHSGRVGSLQAGAGCQNFVTRCRFYTLGVPPTQNQLTLNLQLRANNRLCLDCQKTNQPFSPLLWTDFNVILWWGRGLVENRSRSRILLKFSELRLSGCSNHSILLTKLPFSSASSK